MSTFSRKVWAGNEACEPVTWQECKLVPKTVSFIVPEITCKPRQGKYTGILESFVRHYWELCCQSFEKGYIEPSLGPIPRSFTVPTYTHVRRRALTLWFRPVDPYSSYLSGIMNSAKVASLSSLSLAAPADKLIMA